MRKLITDILVFLLIQAAIALTVLCIAPTRNTSFLAAGRDKHRRLTETPLPRLILIGGSSTAFSFDSTRLRDALGIEPVNMGLHAGLGLPFMINEVRPYLHKGDVVVLSFEYNHFFSHMTSALPDYLFWHMPEGVRYLTTFQEWKCVLDGHLNYWTAAMKAGMGSIAKTRTVTWSSPFQHSISRAEADAYACAKEPPVYHRLAFNDMGDAVAHWNRTPPGISESYVSYLVGIYASYDSRFFDATARCLNQFYTYCQKKGIHVFFAYPAYPEESYTRSKAELERVSTRLETDMDIPILYPQETVLYPSDHFFDTPYHLTREGVVKRTDALAEALRKRHLADPE